MFMCRFMWFFGLLLVAVFLDLTRAGDDGRRFSIRTPAASSSVGLECDPTNPKEKKAVAGTTNAYYYCSLNGTFIRRTCPKDRIFDSSELKCVFSANNKTLATDPLKEPFRQAIAQCPPGFTSYLNMMTGMPMSCNANVNGQCPPSYACEPVTPGIPAGYCCSRRPGKVLQQRVCGSGQPFLQLGSPLVCNPSVPSCPAGYTCQAYSVTGIYYCCSGTTSATNYCPIGTTPLLFNGQPQQCTAGTLNNCPLGYTCTFSPLSRINVCCSGTTTNNGCPSGQIPYLEPSTNQARVCTAPPNANTCPPGFGCILATNLGRYQCCGQSFGCPYNSAGYINPQTGSYQNCALGQINCPNNFRCVQSTTLNFAICCSSSSVITPTLRCPNGLSPLTIGTQAQQCSTVAPCPSGYTCTAIQGISVCCPGASTVCNLPLSYGERCTQAAPTARYYFNPNMGQCLRFIYNGCGGNSNNFPDQTQCNQFCSLAAACPVGDPLTSVTCSGTLPCQNGYDCISTSTGSYCCPNEGTVCSQAQNAGAGCTNPIISSRWFFNTASGTCTQFQYNGCGGNLNNFLNQQQCESFCLTGMCRYGTPFRSGSANQVCTPTANTCPTQYSCQAPLYGPLNTQICCPTARTVCSQAVNIGTTCPSGNTVTSTRYYFNPASNQCQQFQYAGCSGNDNNFRSLTECNNFCSMTICPAGLPLRDPSGNIQICSSSVTCPQANYQCRNSGIGGSSTSVCCPTASLVCNQPLNAGQPCVGNAVQLQQWYYSPQTRQCSQFYYLGCGGNSNRFQDLQTCTTFCASANLGTCPSGLQPYIQPGTTFIQSCTINVPNTCPNGYFCVQSTTGQPVCCRGSATCPAGQTPYIPFGSSTPQLCQFGVNNCPVGYTCSASSLGGVSVCCRIAQTCPSNLPSNGQVCTLNAVNGCPSNYICLPSGGTSTQGVCCQATPVCNTGGTPYYIPGSSNQVQVCSGIIASCPSGTTCTQSSVAGVSICCQGLSACPGGQQPYMQPGTTLPQQCTPNVAGSCPLNYFCTRGTTGQYICCSGSLQCPAGYVAYLVATSTQPQTCTIGGTSTCPQGYNCIQATGTTSRTGVCCGSTTSVACSNGLNPYVNPTTQQKQFCNPQQPTPCPNNYQCYASTLFGQFLCCQSQTTNARCQNGLVPYYIPGTTTPQTCSTLIPNCPGNYVCLPSQVAGTNYCCPSGATAQCPAGTTGAMIYNQIQTCLQGSTTCPTGYSCVQSTAVGQFLCCSTSQSNLNNALCPYGFPYYSPGTTNKQACSMGTVNTCPNGYGCTRAANVNVYLCCGGTVTYANCRNGGTPQIIPGTTQRQSCTLQSPVCGNGFTCQESTVSGTYICCSGTGTPTVAYCPNGQRPLLTATRDPLECVPSVANNCAFGYTCTASTAMAGRNYCCGRGSASDVTCPGSTRPYLQPATGLPLTCSTSFSINSCPNGYSCQRHPNSVTSYCCTGNGNNLQGYCPVGQTAYVAPGRNAPEVCSTFSGCPGPYRCVYSSTRRQYYCCSSTGDDFLGCPTGSRAYINPFINQPQPCSPGNVNSCPSGYTSIRIGAKTKSDDTDTTLIKGEATKKPRLNSITSSTKQATTNPCPSGYLRISGQCLQLFYPGQRGCTFSEQCALRVPGASCSNNYCVCAANLLIHNQNCVRSCPTGYMNVAGRCTSLGGPLSSDTVQAMSKKKNGTIGAWCRKIPETPCLAQQSVCNNETLTCQCIDGYEASGKDCVPETTETPGGGENRFHYLTSLGYWYNKVSNFMRRNNYFN